MKHNIIISVLLTFLVSACAEKQDGTAGLSYRSQTVFPVLSDSVLSLLKNGDIIIRKGDGPLSFHLSRSTGEPYTHCGIIYSDQNKWGVIHTLGDDASDKNIDGIQTQTLADFVRHSADSTLFICRPIFKKDIGDSIVNVAKKYLRQRIPFDYGFSLLTEEKFYCTELLYYVFKDVNDQKNIFDIIMKNRSYILMFSTFFNEKNFKPIYQLKT